MKWIPVYMALALLIASDAHAEIILCKESAVRHEPRADVEYKGDNFAAVSLPDPIMVPVTVDMIDRYDLDISKGVGAETFLGMMEIYRDGRILYDGRDISSDIKDVCTSGTNEFEDIIEGQMIN